MKRKNLFGILVIVQVLVNILIGTIVILSVCATSSCKSLESHSSSSSSRISRLAKLEQMRRAALASSSFDPSSMYQENNHNNNYQNQQGGGMASSNYYFSGGGGAGNNNGDKEKTTTSLSSSSTSQPPAGYLEVLKQQEAELARQLASIRREKLAALRSKPLTIGIIGFGRFGQFIAKTFTKHGRVVVTSRSDYTSIADGMGATYVPLSDPDTFFNKELDVVILAVSILSFESTIEKMIPSLRNYIAREGTGPLVVDVLSVKEHAREVMLQHLPEECDILCTHPMFGPDSGKNGWHNLNFVYEKTRIDKVVFDPLAMDNDHASHNHNHNDDDDDDNNDIIHNETFIDTSGKRHSIHEDSEAHVESMDRIERFLSIWEEEGCRMVPMSCKAHDEYAANSQFITHLMGRILGTQGLSVTPIDTKGFQSVLKLIDSTTADSFDLFYGLYKYNQNSMGTIEKLRTAMDDVVDNLQRFEREEMEKQQQQKKQQQQEQQQEQQQRDAETVQQDLHNFLTGTG